MESIEASTCRQSLCRRGEPLVHTEAGAGGLVFGHQHMVPCPGETPLPTHLGHPGASQVWRGM